ncbi:Uma2 family endonuclease [Methylobacterium flocculans]|uniref:Uma2 family endonuclease n=1 Tax=Methylobacterium flocculans TaxID=2984843 RepID=UPI0021F33BC6|nr:Uma2 family endonuclease [Methylobacterium sp. FF17]
MALDDFEELLADKPRNKSWELIGGRVVRMMVGARWEHARIVQNIALGLEVGFRAEGSSCQTFTETFYMKSKPLEAAMLPDVLVVCGDIEPGATSVENPTVLVEVLSPGTEEQDRFETWAVYPQLALLQHDVLVTRDRPHLEVFDRVEGRWGGFRVIDGLDEVLDLPTIPALLPLCDIDFRVLGT